jgi:hypothetical protein
MHAEVNTAVHRPTAQPIVWLIGLSVLFHVLVLLVFNQDFSIQAEKKPEKINKITATLMFSAEMLAVEPELESEPALEIKQSPVEENLATVIDSSITQPPDLVETELAEKETQEVIKQNSDIEQQPALDTTQQDSEISLSTPIIENYKPPIESTPTVVSRDLAKQHLNHYSQQRNQRMAEDAAHAYRQQRRSPEFPAANVDPFKTEEEIFKEELKVKTDCSSTANKSVVMLASLFGGNINCSKPPPFQEFIDKRLNKEENQQR